MKTSISQKLFLYSLIIIAGNGFMGYSVYKSNQKFRESEQLVQHSEKVISQSFNILSLSKDLEIASRGFVITKDSSFLESYINPAIIFVKTKQLKQLLQNDKKQLQRVDSLIVNLQNYLDFSNEAIQLRSDKGLSIASSLLSTRLGKKYIDRIGRITDEIQLEETRLLKERKLENEHSVAAFSKISVVMFVLMAIFTILLLVVIGNNLFKDKEKKKRAFELFKANKELDFQNEEKEKRAAELFIANKELIFQNEEKEKRAAELFIANKELDFQNEEKEKRAAELVIANKELLFQIKEKENRADELIIADKELSYQNKEKLKRADELILANIELIFQNEEKEKRASELILANKELVFQNEEKEKRAAELVIANKELLFQNKEKENRADELIIADKELSYQNKEKLKRADELIIANNELIFQNEEKEKRASELIIANKELVFQNEEKEKRAAELIIAKENAEESDKLKTAFLQNMSHEIRTPLNGIIGFSALLNFDDISKEEIKEYTALINQSGKRLIEIVNNVLDISKIQTGQIKIEQKAIIIKSMFSDLFTFFSPIASIKKISLKYHNEKDEQRSIFTDEAKLHQILVNLINNALKFTKSGQVDYGYEVKGDILQFFVKDTGIGIEEELYEKIFERFIQAEQSMTKNYEGAGLGLAISKGLIELLGGKIWVKSEIGNGSTFFFTLPYSHIILPSEKAARYVEKFNKHAHGKILIAEDDWISFQYLSKIFAKSNITIVHAENGEQAVEIIKNTDDIDLVLMDIKMPVMDGIQATKLIKQMKPNLPIFAQTAYAFNEEKNNILAVGCDEYMTKPLNQEKLNKLIIKYLTK